MNKKTTDPIKEISLKFQAYVSPPNFDPNHFHSVPKVDVIKFIENSLNKFNEVNRIYLKNIFLKEAENAIKQYDDNIIPRDNNYLNALKVFEYLNNKIIDQPNKIKLNNSISDKQLVYLFRILYDKYCFQSNKKEIAKAISYIFNIKESTATKYLSDKELEKPKSIFKADWDEL